MHQETFWEWANRLLNWGIYLNADGYPNFDIKKLPNGKKGKSLELLQRVFNGMDVEQQVSRRLREHVLANRTITDAGYKCSTINFSQNMVMIWLPRVKLKYYPFYKRTKNFTPGGMLQPYLPSCSDWNAFILGCNVEIKNRNDLGGKVTLSDLPHFLEIIEKSDEPWRRLWDGLLFGA